MACVHAVQALRKNRCMLIMLCNDFIEIFFIGGVIELRIMEWKRGIQQLHCTCKWL